MSIEIFLALLKISLVPAKPNSILEYVICIPENNRRLDLCEVRLNTVIIRKYNLQDPQSIMKFFW